MWSRSSGAHLTRDDSPGRFDILPLLIATDGAISAFGHDGRRLRPNLVIGEVDGLAEPTWPGQRLRIGDVIIGIDDLRSRCVMTTFDPDTLEQDRQVLKGIVQRFGGKQVHAGTQTRIRMPPFPTCSTAASEGLSAESASAAVTSGL